MSERSVKEIVDENGFTVWVHKDQHSIVEIQYGDVSKPIWDHDDDYERFRLFPDNPTAKEGDKE